MNFAAVIGKSIDLIPWRVRNQVKRIPLVAPLQRWLISHAMDGAEFVHKISAGPAKGLRFPVRLPDDKLYWTGTWEHEITSAIAREISPGAVCFDVGSHRAFVAGVMACAGARTVYCFEPNAENGAKIEQLIALNTSMDLRLMGFAIGSGDGHAKFEIMRETSMGKLAGSPFQADASNVATIDVAVRSLDQLVSSGDVEPPDLIKIDIEGGELDALVGAEKLVADYGPTFVIEVHSFDLLQQCRDWLVGRGYDVRFVEDGIEDAPSSAFRVCHILATRA